MCVRRSDADEASAVSVVCIVALALGIGANAAIFSMAEAFLLHPVPFENADRYIALLDIVTRRRAAVASARRTTFPSHPRRYFDWKKEAKSFDQHHRVCVG